MFAMQIFIMSQQIKAGDNGLGMIDTKVHSKCSNKCFAVQVVQYALDLAFNDSLAVLTSSRHRQCASESFKDRMILSFIFPDGISSIVENQFLDSRFLFSTLKK